MTHQIVIKKGDAGHSDRSYKVRVIKGGCIITRKPLTTVEQDLRDQLNKNTKPDIIDDIPKTYEHDNV